MNLIKKYDDLFIRGKFNKYCYFIKKNFTVMSFKY